MDKVRHNFAFICKMFDISKILSELGQYDNIKSNSTHSRTNFYKDGIIKKNENYCQIFDHKLTDKDRSVPIMYWLLKLHKIPIEARFIIAFKNCSTKPLSGVFSKSFKCFLVVWKTFIIKAYFIQVTKNPGFWKIIFELLKAKNY